MWLAFSIISCKLCLLLLRPLHLCVDCLRGGMNHFLLERSMRKGEKRIALSLADCDRRHGRPMDSAVCLILVQCWRETVLRYYTLTFPYFQSVFFGPSGFLSCTVYGLKCAKKCPWRRDRGRKSIVSHRKSEEGGDVS